MTPKRIDIHIICAKCQKPVEERDMLHDPGAGLYRFFVTCHGAKDFGPHLTVAHTVEKATLDAFPPAAASSGGTPT